MARKITRNEFKKSIHDILGLFETEVLPVGELGRQERIELMKISFEFFFEHYMPHYAEQGSPEFHGEIVELLESDAENISIAAPRGFAKSTIVSFAYIIWCVLREKYKFVILISATDDLAEDLADFIRLEFTDNKRILEDFGALLRGIGEQGDFVVNKTRVLARGRKQAVRGFRNRNQRPDLIILDDIEKDEESLSPTTVGKTLDGIRRGLIPALAPKGKIVLVGTILRTRSVAGTMLLSEDEPWNVWERRIYRAIMPDGKGGECSLWAERFPLEYLNKQKILLGISGFNAEYQNLPSDDDNAMFTESMIVDGRNPADSPMVMFIDPSVDGIKKNDYKACMLVSKDDDNYCIEGAVLVQGSDKKFFEGVVELYNKFSKRILGTYSESNGFQIYFMRDLEAFAKERGVNLNLSGVRSVLKKEMRINQLVPLFETRRITFAPEFRKSREGKILVEQLLSFPNSKVHDDAPDALAGAVKALESRTSKGGFAVVPKIKRKLRFFGR